MREASRIRQSNNSLSIAEIVNHEIETVRRAWRLTSPEAGFREPRWFKAAASAAVKAGKLAKRGYGGSVISQLHAVGYHKALDHMAVVRIDGERHVIFEPYESSCSMDTARRIAAELAILLYCDAWVSLRSWHYPGKTIRITLAKSQMQPTTHCEQDSSVGSSATMQLKHKQTNAPESRHHIDVGSKCRSTA
jgi:hypothetical protein